MDLAINLHHNCMLVCLKTQMFENGFQIQAENDTVIVSV